MDNTILIMISSFLAAVILIVIALNMIQKLQMSKYKKEIIRLDIERNKIVGVPILSEISKVRDLVKTDNLKKKLDDWDITFKLIKDERVPKLSDMLVEADFFVEKKNINGL